MSKRLFAEYTCDWCDAEERQEVDLEAQTKHELPPGWGFVQFTVRPGDPDVPEWSKAKYNACSRACAGELVNQYYPRKDAFYARNGVEEVA